MTNKRISELTEQKTKYRGSCIQSNRLVSLIKNIVASKIILFAIIFNNGDPYRSSVQKIINSFAQVLDFFKDLLPLPKPNIFSSIFMRSWNKILDNLGKNLGGHLPVIASPRGYASYNEKDH